MVGKGALGESVAANENRMERPSLGVVIAAYNCEDTIAQTLTSIGDQAVDEIIVVDDGSTDRTAAAARAHPLAEVVSQGNAGPGAARNTGVGLSDSEWVVFLDADDLWFPWTVDSLCAAIEAAPGARFGLLQPAEFEGDLETLPASEKFMTAVHDPACAAFAENDQMPFVGSGALVVRRDLFDEVGGFSNDVRFAEDLDFILRAARISPLWILAQPLGFAYRRGDGGLTTDLAGAFRGIQFLLREHAAGAYGRDGQVDAAVSNFARPVAVALARAGETKRCLALYRLLLQSQFIQCYVPPN